MKVSITIIVLISSTLLNGAQSKKVKNYYGNAISDAKGFQKPLASPLGNSINDIFKRFKRDTTKSMQELQKMLDMAKSECINELKMDPQIMEKSVMHAENPTTNEKCLMFCILKKTNLMENNQLSLKTIGRIASIVSQENPLVISLVVAKANNCNTMIQPNKPACEVAYEINRCISDELKARKLNFNY